MSTFTTFRRRTTRSSKREKLVWPRDDYYLNFELYTFNYVTSNEHLKVNSSSKQYQTNVNDISSKQFGLRTVDGSKDEIIFYEGDEVLGFDEYRKVDSQYSKNYDDFFYSNKKETPFPGITRMYPLDENIMEQPTSSTSTTREKSFNRSHDVKDTSLIDGIIDITQINDTQDKLTDIRKNSKIRLKNDVTSFYNLPIERIIEQIKDYFKNDIFIPTIKDSVIFNSENNIIVDKNFYKYDYLFPWWYYMNHNYENPTLELQEKEDGRFVFIARKDIRPREPLTWNYYKNYKEFQNTTETEEETLFLCMKDISLQVIPEELKQNLQEKYKNRIKEAIEYIHQRIDYFKKNTNRNLLNTQFPFLNNNSIPYNGSLRDHPLVVKNNSKKQEIGRTSSGNNRKRKEPNTGFNNNNKNNNINL